MKNQVVELRKNAEKSLQQISAEFTKKFEKLEAEFELALREQEYAYKEEKKNLAVTLAENYDTLSQEDLSPEIIEKRTKQNQWEMKIDLNLINKIGVLLILLGMGVAFKYSFDH